MLLGSDAEAARSSLYRQVKKANKEASKRRRDEKKSNKSRLRQLNREIRMIEKLLEKNVPTIDYTPEQNKKRLGIRCIDHIQRYNFAQVLFLH